MRIIIFLLVFFMCNCSVKHKLTESAKSDWQKITGVKRLQSKNEKYRRDLSRIDSNDYKVLYKIYPKDLFIIDQSGFKGSADSVFLSGGVTHVSKVKETIQNDKSDKLNETFTEKQILNEKLEKNKGEKHSFTFWLLLTLSIVFCYLLLYRKGFKLKRHKY